MTINKNSVEQINVALLDLDKKIKSANNANDLKNLEASVDSIKRTLNEKAAGLESGKTYDINISGNAATATKATTATTAEKATNANHAETATTAEAATNASHAETATTATKVANALTVNGKTYDGLSAVDAGVQTVANGGTGVTTQDDINKAFISNLYVGNDDVTDGTEFVSSWASDNGFNETTEGAVNTPYKRQFIKVWNYIKDKISSVLGLTKDNYVGTARTADIAYSLTYKYRNEINFKGGAQTQCWFNYRNDDTGDPSPVDNIEYRFCNYGGDTSKSVLVAGGFVGNLSGKADTAGTADSATTAGTADNLTAGAVLNGNNKITTTNPTKIDAGQIKVHTVYAADGPAMYGNLINIGGNGGFQFFVEWTGTQTQAGQDLIGRIFTRFWRDNQSAWTAWEELAYNNANVTFKTARASSKMVIPIGSPSSLEDGCIWIER